MFPENIDLPISSVVPEIRKALSTRPNTLLQAPPGAGKTTLVPLALLDEPWLEGRKIIMLEPRRLATRAAAMRMADLMGEKPGQTVGYRMRMDTKVGPKTRIEVVTEGILTRLLQEDPSLERVGLLIFDEFHERSIHADLGLALALESQDVLRDELKILIMSATLDGEALASMLDNAPVITSKGRSFPVDTRYEPVAGFKRDALDAYNVIPKVIAKIRQVIEEEDGDILVFLPGVSEIRRVDKGLRASGLAKDVLICPLYANLSKGEQGAAILSSAQNKRKIVLATSIAETSLTIEGVRIVIDSGLMRVSRFSPGSGMSRLETVEVTRASADQRRGRAGRLEEGVCYRLWPKAKILKEHGKPEIVEADLTSLALELALWGEREATRLRWLDMPPKSAMSHAGELLKLLEAVDDEGSITAYGKKMANLPLHPRLAHMVLKGKELGLASLACYIAAILSEKDMLRCDRGYNDADVRLRVDLLKSSEPLTFPGVSLDLNARKRIRLLADQLMKKLGGSTINADSNQSGLLLAFAYPDRIAKKRVDGAGTFLLSNGKGAHMNQHEPLARESYLAVSSLSGETRDSPIFMAAPLSLEEIEMYFVSLIKEVDSIRWVSSSQSVVSRRKRHLGSILLSDGPIADPDGSLILEAMLKGVRQAGIDSFPWNKKNRMFQNRVNFLHKQKYNLPDFSDDTLLENIGSWLAPWLSKMTRLDHLKRLDLQSILSSMLSYEKLKLLDKEAPTHILVPSGSRIPIDYEDSNKPFLAVRLQEMFGLDETPSVAGGRVKLRLHLLSPANRPIQVTEDLGGFWEKTYFDVRKEMKGRYPKHYWPDDPLNAMPTKRVKRRKAS